MKKIVASLALAAAVIATPSAAFAHVIVTPSEVTTASYQTFTTSVPNERDIAITGLRLVIPNGLDGVTPTVKPGWTIDMPRNGDSVTEITWTGGNIPAGQRDDFTFSAQAPAKAITLQWKAYQTYEDGTVVAWDQKPTSNEDDDSGAAGPYSETKIVNDLSKPAIATAKPSDSSSSDTLAVALGTLGVLLGGAALFSKRK